MRQKTSGRGKGRGKGRGSRQPAAPTPGDGEEQEIIDSEGSAAEEIAGAGAAERNGAPA